MGALHEGHLNLGKWMSTHDAFPQESAKDLMVH